MAEFGSSPTSITSPATIFSVFENHGQLWSHQYGMIDFTSSKVKNFHSLTDSSETKQKLLVLGAAVIVYAERNASYTASKSQSSSISEWTAVEVEILDFPSTSVVEGVGILTKIREGHANLDCEEFSFPLFVPGFAVRNPHGRNCQLSELEAKKLHFLAIPNPRINYRDKFFVISVHPVDSSFCKGHQRECLDHWFRAQSIDNNDISRGYRLLASISQEEQKGRCQSQFKKFSFTF